MTNLPERDRSDSFLKASIEGAALIDKELWRAKL